MSYFLHRISHEWSISKPLLDKGYLTVGWQYMLGSDETVKSVTENADRDTVHEAMNRYHESEGWDLMYRGATRSLSMFSQFRPGDVVIVPLYWGYFRIVRVKSSPKPVTELPASALEGLPAVLKNDSGEKGLYTNGKEIDLGFYVEIEPVVKSDIQRSYANSALQSRMKIRQTNADINDLESEILSVAERKEPVNLYDVIADKAANIILTAINDNANPIDTEKLVRWYMKKAGAAKVYKPSKPKGNPDEYNYADADVAAEFSPLGVNIYIQVKKHDGTTGDWAVQQIKKYKELQTINFAEGETNIMWVLSTAGEFSKEAISLAQENSVRLINGMEFARMLADAGISDINDFTSM